MCVVPHLDFRRREERRETPFYVFKATSATMVIYKHSGGKTANRERDKVSDGSTKPH